MEMRYQIIAFVIGEMPKVKRVVDKQPAVMPPTGKSAPRYIEKTVPQHVLIDTQAYSLGDIPATLALKRYSRDSLVAELRFEVQNIFTDETLELKEKALDYCYDFLKMQGIKNEEESMEEYALFVISDYHGEPEQFFAHKEKIASFLKSERGLLDAREIEHTLSMQLQYAKDDLVIVDWDGAWIFDPHGDIESAVELFQIANTQLLRYRVLDKDLDIRLRRVARLIEERPPQKKFFFSPGEVHQSLRQLMLIRSRSISEFQAVERDIKLIGDWYSARLFELTAKKFKLDEWRASIREKLESLEDVYTIASENFTISWERRSKIIEMIGWYVLLTGWLVLLILDFYFYKF